MKRLFNDKCEWTDEAREVSNFASKKLDEIYEAFPDYSPREISHIICLDNINRECYTISRKRMSEKTLKN